MTTETELDIHTEYLITSGSSIRLRGAGKPQDIEALHAAVGGTLIYSPPDDVSSLTHTYNEETQTFSLIPTQPTPDAIWLHHESRWLVPGVEDIRIKKNAEINQSRLTANRNTFQFAGKAISCDELSRSDIDGVNGYVTLNGALPPNFPGAWKAADNTYVSVPDLDAWKSFYTSLVVAGQINFAHAQALKATLALATTIEEIEAITW